jgi:hypothetical protein
MSRVEYDIQQEPVVEPQALFVSQYLSQFIFVVDSHL